MPRQPWQPAIEIDRDAGLPPFLQITRSLTADIQRGRLRPGDRLPGSRELAASLGVHRNTVLAALGELSAEGWIETTPGRGVYVTHNITQPRGKAFSRLRTGAPTSVSFSLPEVPCAYRPPALPKGTLDLSNGAPDTRLVPARILGRAFRSALVNGGASVLRYGGPEGHPKLRQALAAMLSGTRGLAVGAEDILVTRGSQMALSLTARALVRPGDAVAIEASSYRPAWEAFRSAGATVIPVAVDSGGVNVEALQHLASRTELRAIYLTPHHQYPTTVTLKAARRLALLALAREHGIAIIEDDYDHEFHYEGRPVLPLASADHTGLVIYIGTLSKVLAPGLRIGYIVAARAMRENMCAIRSLLDIQGDLVTEAAVASLIDDGELQRHVARVRRIYAARREILSTAFRSTFGDAIDFTLAPGGMAIWARFPMKVDVEAWARRSIRHGVSWYTGKRYAVDGQPNPFARFTFAWLNEQELPEAVKRMSASLKGTHSS
jgi:GntR family transcriptional regulator/MocR family aminotransferase